MAINLGDLLEQCNIRKKEKYLNILADFVGFKKDKNTGLIQTTPSLTERSFGELLKRHGNRLSTEYTYNLRGNLRRDLRILEKLGIIKHKKNGKYWISPKWKDIAYQSLVLNKITNLGGHGLFKEFGIYFFGIKEDWCRYPEFIHLSNILHDSLPLWYRVSQIKRILLIREFGEKWRKFLSEDIHPFIKFRVWRFVLNYHSIFTHPRGGDHQLEDISGFLEFFGKKLNIMEHQDSQKKFHEKVQKESKDFDRISQSDEMTSFLDFMERLRKIVGEYEKMYIEAIDEIGMEQMDKEAQRDVIDILDHAFKTTRYEPMDLGIYIDIPQCRSLGELRRINFKRLTDNVDTNFEKDKAYREIYKGREKIELRLDQEKDNSRLFNAIAEEITMPPIAIYTNPQLDKIIDKAIAVLEENEIERHAIQTIKQSFREPKIPLIMIILRRVYVELDLYMMHKVK